MTLPFPSRVPMKGFFVFAISLFIVELAEGTGLVVALLVLAFMLLAAVNFNICGGITRPSGAYVLFGVALSGALGITVKALIGEPLGSTLIDARGTLLVYAVMQLPMMAAALASNYLRAKKPLLQELVRPERARQTAMGAIIMGIALPYVLSGIAAAESAFNQINRFAQFGLMLAVYYRVKQTGGRSCVTPEAIVATIFCFYLGLTSFSKEALFYPIAVWLIAAAAAGLRFSVTTAVLTSAGICAYLVLMTPYSQVGRDLQFQYENRTDAIIYLLSHPLETRTFYNQSQEDAVKMSAQYYRLYDKPMGLLDRLNMIGVDDALIARTNKGYYSPAGNELVAFWLNIIPRVFWPDKPMLYYGNMYAHEIGMIAPDDVSTGISFSYNADAYHIGGWPVVLMACPFFFFVLFWVSDSVAGSAKESPWPLCYAVLFAHTAPEGGIGWTTYGASFATFGIIVMAYSMAYIAPLIGALVIGPEKPAAVPAIQAS